MTIVDVLITTYNHPSALAITLTSLIAQSFQDFRIIVSDQTETFDVIAVGEVQSVLRVLRSHHHPIETYRHLPRRGIAEQRQFLLDQVTAPYDTPKLRAVGGFDFWQGLPFLITVAKMSWPSSES